MSHMRNRGRPLKQVDVQSVVSASAASVAKLTGPKARDGWTVESRRPSHPNIQRQLSQSEAPEIIQTADFRMLKNGDEEWLRLLSPDTLGGCL